MSSREHRTAIHEAGHFVAARAFGHGVSLLLTIQPETVAGVRRLGVHKRTLTVFEDLCRRATRDGCDISAAIANEFPHRRQELENLRPTLAAMATLEHLMGAAADTELSTGDGTFVPNHALATGTGTSIVVNQSNNFQSGVTRQEVAALLPRMVESAKAAVADAVQRGGGYRRSFA